jgi:hypothetical protein
MICKIDGCQGEGRVCGMCGQATCDTHGHEATGHDELIGVIVSGWICNDCSDTLTTTVTPYLPHLKG